MVSAEESCVIVTWSVSIDLLMRTCHFSVLMFSWLQAIVVWVLLWHFNILNTQISVIRGHVTVTSKDVILESRSNAQFFHWPYNAFFSSFSQAVMNELNAYSFFLRSFVSAYMQTLGVELFMTRTVHEVLWGFKDPLLTKLHTLKPEVDEYFGLMWKVRVSVFVLFFF